MVMTGDPVLECRGLQKAYGKIEVLKGCDLKVFPGELVGLVGENGSGKTTLIRCVLGFAKPSGGSTDIEGRIGYCPQENILNHAYTVREHLELAETIYAQHGSLDPGFLRDLVSRFRLEKYLDRSIGALSGGSRQKVLFLTSILHRPDLLLLDEPYEGFDWKMYLTFWDTIRHLCDASASVLLITHFVYDRDRFDRIYELRDGKTYVEEV